MHLEISLHREMVISEDPSLCMAATGHAEAVLISNNEAARGNMSLDF